MIDILRGRRRYVLVQKKFVHLQMPIKNKPTYIVKVIRDVRDRGRDIDGIIKQWFAYVKPNFEKVR